MSFKRLGDRKRRRALIPFLAAANAIHGLLITLVRDKKVKGLYLDCEGQAQLQEKLELESKWKPKEFDRAVQLSHLVGFILGGLSREGQHVYWISDEDSFFANQKRHADMSRIASFFTSVYVDHGLGEVGVGTTAIDEGDLLEEDLTAIPDLAAGCAAEVATRISSMCGGVLPDGIAIELPSFSWKVEVILDWLSVTPGSLAKVAISFNQTPNGLRVGRFATPAG